MKAVQQNIRRIENDTEDGGITGTTLETMSTSAGAVSVLTQAQNATRIYTNYFGKIPYNRVAMTQQPAGFFGQAWATLVFMPYTAFLADTERVQLFGIRGGTDGFWNEVAPHEVAHQWWGHSVGWTSYHDQWMSEGFSEFSASLYIQMVEKDINKFIAFWENQRKLITEASPATKGRKPFTVGPVTQGYRLNNAKTGSIARAMIYPKGAYILHMIRMMMYDARGGTGDERFKKMMQDFIQSHYNKDVSTNDFKLAVEKHMTAEMNVDKNGKMDWFFDEYVYGTEMPSYKFTYQITDAPGGKATLTGKITQSNVSDKFVMRVPLYADYGKGWSYVGAATVAGSSTLDLTNIPLPGKPKKVAIAALKDILAENIDDK
jgi:aminopeptidase N